jgi:tripartite-type tricarboxylate transporter receptor subunit TctC
VGSTQSRRVNVRVIGASNAPLRDLVAAGSEVVIGFSAGSFIAKSNLVAPGLPPAGVGMGLISDNGAGTNPPPDGYTLLLISAAGAINASLYEKLSFNFIRDIAPVAGISRSPNVLVVHPSVPAKTVVEFIAYGKTNPAKLNMASDGSGTAQHVAGELFKLMTGTNMVHIPYRGSGPAVTDVIGGQVQVMFGDMSSAIEHIRAGRLRPLGVTTVSRSAALPDLPPIAEFVPGYEASTWFGIGVPKKTPSETIGKLNRDISAALADSRIESRLADLGGVPMRMTPVELEKLIAEETEKWGTVIRAAGIKPE